MPDPSFQTILPVLTYHTIDDGKPPLSIAPDRFKRQMTTLADAGWRTLSLDEALAGHHRGKWPLRSMMLTFDDGYASVGDRAVPVLATCGFRGIVFAVSDFVDQKAPRNRGAGITGPLLGWSELLAMTENGWTVGAHSRTHPALSKLNAEAAESEIAGSKRDLEDRCGVRVEAFAYPYGLASPNIEQIVAVHYRAAFGTTLAYVTSTSRLTYFERIDACYLGESPAALLDRRLFRAYIALRRAGRAIRQTLQRGTERTD
jgi:peptidoglycan/xylan/chitin deacetylase (PgdA/CDA1 family)